MKLPSLRERSNETSSDQQQERIEIGAWTGTWPEYLEYLAARSRGRQHRATDTRGKYQQQANTPAAVHPDFKCTRPGNGNLSLDMFPLSEPLEMGERPRSASDSSSSYDDDDAAHPGNNRPAEGDAPKSPPPKNTLQLSDLEKYSRANDRLSNLRSSSGSANSGGRSFHGAAEDAAAAVEGWESLLRLSGSHDQHMRENKGQHDEPDGYHRDTEAARRVTSQNRRTMPFVGKSFRWHTAGGESHSSNHENRKRNSVPQMDGPVDFHQSIRATESSEEPLSPIHDHGGTKRKASHFSLRSLSSSFAAKRPRISFRKLATSVSKGFTQAKRNLRQRNVEDRRNFEA